MNGEGHEPDEELELYREPAEDDDAPPSIPAPAAADAPATSAVEPAAEQTIRVIAVAGAKGGAGKTLLSANLAIYLATIGRRVLLVDADADGANLHTFLGVERPGRGPMPVFDPVAAARGEESSDVDDPRIVDTAVPGLRLMHAGVDEPVRGQRQRTRRGVLRRELNSLDADYAVVDLGAGTDRELVDFFLFADVSVFVSVPEPTAIDNSYRFIRSAFARQLRRAAPDPDTRRRVVARLRAMGNTPAPLDLARRLEAAGDPLSDLVRASIDDFSFHFILNQARVRADLDLGEAMRVAARRRFGLRLDYLGYIDYDDTVWSCIRMRRPLLVESPGTKASKSIEKIARRVLALDTGTGRREQVRNVPPESHHDLLEVDRGATDEEVRRAYKRIKEIYASNALCCYGLFDDSAMDSLRARLEEAYDVLLDPARRRPYELSVFPVAPEPADEPTGASDDTPKPPPPVITPDTEYTGALLRAVRESQGIEIRDISQRTKIGSAYLRAIEEDDYNSLPAPVYVRGFVTEVAKCLRLDWAQVSRTYVRRYKRFLDERQKAHG